MIDGIKQTKRFCQTSFPPPFDGDKCGITQWGCRSLKVQHISCTLCDCISVFCIFEFVYFILCYSKSDHFIPATVQFNSQCRRPASMNILQRLSVNPASIFTIFTKILTNFDKNFDNFCSVQSTVSSPCFCEYFITSLCKSCSTRLQSAWIACLLPFSFLILVGSCHF